jgi:hypothetical protein
MTIDGGEIQYNYNVWGTLQTPLDVMTTARAVPFHTRPTAPAMTAPAMTAPTITAPAMTALEAERELNLASELEMPFGTHSSYRPAYAVPMPLSMNQAPRHSGRSHSHSGHSGHIVNLDREPPHLIVEEEPDLESKLKQASHTRPAPLLVVEPPSHGTDKQPKQPTQQEQQDQTATKRLRLRDPIFALLFLLALAHLGYLTLVGSKSGHADYIFQLAKALSSDETRHAVFEFPLVRAFVSRLGGTLSFVASAMALPLALASLLFVRIAGRFTILAASASSCLALCIISAWQAVRLYDRDRELLATLCVVGAFVALLLLYLLYIVAPTLLQLGKRLERSASVVLQALPSLFIVSLMLTLMHSLFLMWWAITTASLMTTRIVGSIEPEPKTEPSDYDYDYTDTEAWNDSVHANLSSTDFIYVGGSELSVYFCVFMLWLVSNIAASMLRMSVAGGVHSHLRKRSPNLGVLIGFARALTVSLGSLVLASLLLTVVETLLFLVVRAKKATKRLRSIFWLTFLYTTASWALSIVLFFVRFINSFAIVEIAFSKKSFFKASRRVYERLAEQTGAMFASYTTTAYIMTALKILVATLSVLIALLVQGLPLRILWSTQALVPLMASYGIAALPMTWLESASHALLINDLDSFSD